MGGVVFIMFLPIWTYKDLKRQKQQLSAHIYGQCHVYPAQIAAFVELAHPNATIKCTSGKESLILSMFHALGKAPCMLLILYIN